MSKTKLKGLKAWLTHPVGLILLFLLIVLGAPILLYAFTDYDLLRELTGG